MTQIRLRPADENPGTHILIIGVGDYLHLRGGSQASTTSHLGLSVLSSPPISAMHLVKWMIGDPDAAGLNNPNAPLATLEIFVSSRTGESLDVNGLSHTIERASSPLVTAGFDRWLVEVKRNPRNVGILYFCGHGLMGPSGEQILLLEDHGTAPNRPFAAGSFDISATIRSLLRHVEAQLYVFIDACRKYSSELGGQIGSGPNSLLSGGNLTEVVNRGMTKIESTGDGEEAYGDENGVSRFTEALLQALQGYCGVPEPGSQRWLINGGALAQAMPKLLALVNTERGGRRQSCTPCPSGAVDEPLHITMQIPKVKVEIDLSPEVMRTVSQFLLTSVVDATMPQITGGLINEIWRTEVQKGVYEVRIASANLQPYASGQQYFEPPLYRLPVEIR